MTQDPLLPPSDSPNPYAPTAQPGARPGTVNPNEFEAYRHEHLSHEASVQSIGCLYYLGAVLVVLMGVGYAFLGASSKDPNIPGPMFLVMGLGMIAMGFAQGFVGYGLRRLLPWARIGGIVLSVIGLLGIPIGTIISAYVLYLLVSNKGEIVFSDRYKHVISQTPHIQYRTSIIVKIFVGILIAVVALILVAVLFTG